MTIQTKGGFIWLIAGIGGAAMAGPLVPFGLALIWTSRRCSDEAVRRGWIEVLPELPEAEKAKKVLTQAMAEAQPSRAEEEAGQGTATHQPLAKSHGEDEPTRAAVATMERQFDAVKAEVEEEERVTRSKKTAIDRIKASPYTSRLFLGSQRTGKSYLAAAAAAEIGVDVYHINLASNLGSDDTEDARYWAGVKASVCCKLKRMDEDDAAQKIAEAIEVFYQFEDSRRPSILIVDEWAEIGSQFHRYSYLLDELLKLLANECASLASTGTKQKKAIWAIAPMMVAGDLVQPAKAIKSLKLCYVTIPPGRVIQWTNSDGEDNAVTFDDALFEQVKNNFKGVSDPGKKWTDDRIVWVGGSWLPVGELKAL
jgi:hypothetical protein